tara:strand:- start:354 stop:836 length:483 start_codon:yes stop_codon:yes gene_type:complete
MIAKKFNKKKYKIFSNKLSRPQKKIFINWLVPKNWPNKAYPIEYWNNVIEELKNKTNYKIVWQKKNGDLNYLIKSIKNSEMVISVVSLACHLAMLYNRKLVMLSGPNFFDDVKLYNKSKTIFPSKKCPVHKKQLNINYKYCFCMKNISPKKVSKVVINEL